MKHQRVIFLFHYVTGLVDFLTGIFLVIAPSWTLRLMQVKARDEASELVSYIGVFVFAVGASHFLAGGFPQNEVSKERWKTLWKVSSLVRFSVAFFVFWQVFIGHLELMWLSVALTDLSVATIFVFFLCTKPFEQR